MGLGELAAGLELGELGEEDGGGAGLEVVEDPLHEVDLGALAVARHGEDEGRVAPGGGFHGGVGGGGDDGAEGVGVRGVAEAPDGG